MNNKEILHATVYEQFATKVAAFLASSETTSATNLTVTEFCERFSIPLARLGAVNPTGPKYVGNYTFEVHRLTKELLVHVKELRGQMNPCQLQEYLFTQMGVSVRAESLAQLYKKGKLDKYWTIKRTQELKEFEKSYHVNRPGRNFPETSAINPKSFYKPFIEFAIKNRWEYWQIAAVLERAPGTIRNWANNYGYKERAIVKTRTHNQTGKVSRTEARDEQLEFDFNLGSALSNYPLVNKSAHRLDIVREDRKQSAPPQPTPPETKKEEEMLVSLPAGILDSQDAERFIGKLSWIEVLKRVQNPLHLFKVATAKGFVLFKLKTADPYNKFVELEYVSTINAHTV